MVISVENKKKSLLAALPLFLIVGAAGALITYQFITPPLTVYEHPRDIIAASIFNKEYAIVGEDVELTGTITNPNEHWNFSIASITLENLGTASIKIWYGDINNYIELQPGKSITIPVAQLPITNIGAGANESFTAQIIPLTAGTLQLAATLQGDWALVP